jgi:hypothetical protein
LRNAWRAVGKPLPSCECHRFRKAFDNPEFGFIGTRDCERKRLSRARRVVAVLATTTEHLPFATTAAPGRHHLLTNSSGWICAKFYDSFRCLLCRLVGMMLFGDDLPNAFFKPGNVKPRAVGQSRTQCPSCTWRACVKTVVILYSLGAAVSMVVRTVPPRHLDK